MGGMEKPLIQINGRSLVEAISSRVLESDINVRLSCVAELPYRNLGFPVVLDDGKRGPLGGIRAALFDCPTRYAFFCPGDGPNMNATVIHALAQEIGNADIAVAHDGQRIQPLYMLTSKDCRLKLIDFLDRGNLRVEEWVLSLNHVVVKFDEPDLFANINTNADLQVLESAQQ